MNSSTVLLRQINPNFLKDQHLTSQAFMPFPKDDFLLSVYDADQITAQQSHQHFTKTQGFDSCGVYGVSVQEVTDLSLSARPDPLLDFVQHAVIDFTSQKKDFRKLAKKLRDHAVQRGCLYFP